VIPDPVSAGAVHDTTADPFPGTPTTPVGAAPLEARRTRASDGVSVPSVDVKMAWYCTYRAAGLLICVPVTGDHRDHVAASFEVRVLNWMLVPAGVVTTGSRLIHAR
jgi:hypothetical protein